MTAGVWDRLEIGKNLASRVKCRMQDGHVNMMGMQYPGTAICGSLSYPSIGFRCT